MRTIRENFLRHVDVTEGCWLWTGSIREDGYACFSFKVNGVKFTRFVHRIAYELFVAPIPEGLELDHLCRIRSCVNPSHLEPVTPKVNTSRSLVGVWQVLKTHCPKGHLYDTANTRVSESGKRSCRTCHRDKMRFRSYPYLRQGAN